MKLPSRRRPNMLQLYVTEFNFVSKDPRISKDKGGISSSHCFTNTSMFFQGLSSHFF